MFSPKICTLGSKLRARTWINGRILKMMRLRDKIFRSLRKDNADDKKSLYKKLRNRVTLEWKNSKTAYFKNYFLANKQNMKPLWSGIKSIISVKTSTSSSVKKIKDKKGNVTSDPMLTSNIFNDYFVNVAKNITAKSLNPLNHLLPACQTKIQTQSFFRQSRIMKLKTLL